MRETFEDLGYFIECPAISGRREDNYRQGFSKIFSPVGSSVVVHVRSCLFDGFL